MLLLWLWLWLISCETNIVQVSSAREKTVSVPSHFPRVETCSAHSVFTPWISLKAGGILMEQINQKPGFKMVSIPRSCTFLPNVACKHFGKVDNDCTWSYNSGSSDDWYFLQPTRTHQKWQSHHQCQQCQEEVLGASSACFRRTYIKQCVTAKHFPPSTGVSGTLLSHDPVHFSFSLWADLLNAIQRTVTMYMHACVKIYTVSHYNFQ